MPKIFIDPGHGGSDTANRGPTGYVEAYGVLDIALRLKACLCLVTMSCSAENWTSL